MLPDTESPKNNEISAVHHLETDSQVIQNAMAAAAEEKAMGFKEVMKIHWKAAMWSCIFSLALVMEGYDLGIVSDCRRIRLIAQINSFYGQASFLKRFGSVTEEGKLFIPANWQAAINNAASIGQVIGLVINGFAQSRYGSKKVYCCAMVGMCGAIFIPVFSTSLPMLFAGELVCGIPWGIFRGSFLGSIELISETLSTAYAAEVCPLALRGYLTSFVNMCWGFGLFLAAGVVRASIEVDSQWGKSLLLLIILTNLMLLQAGDSHTCSNGCGLCPCS